MEPAVGVMRLNGHDMFQSCVGVIITPVFAGRSQRALAETTPWTVDREIMELNYTACVALTKVQLLKLRGLTSARVPLLGVLLHPASGDSAAHDQGEERAYCQHKQVVCDA